MKKNKVLESIKNILIIFLIIFAVYQFFDMYTTDGIGEITSSWFDDNETFYFMPNDIMISFGDKEFVKIKSDSMQEELVSDYIKEIYDILFRTKISFEETNEKVLDVVNNRSIILVYDEYNHQMINELFDISNEKILREISGIDNIIICPSTSEGDKCHVYIYGSGRLLKFEINIDTTELYGLIDEINIFDKMNIYLLSENSKYKNSFKNYVFIPAVIIENELFDNDKKISIRNPFIKEGSFDEETLEGYINTYFNNPNAKWKMEKDINTLIYGDGEKTITAYKDGFVTYSYSQVDEKQISINDAINIAKERMDKDIYLSNNYILSDVKKISNSSYELYYDYYINNSKILLSNNVKTKYRIYYPLSITVSGNDITNIKAVILEFNKEEEEIEEDQIILDKEFSYNINTYDYVINDFLSNYPDLLIKNLKLGYFKPNMIDNLKLKWVIETDKEIYTYDVYK